MRYRSLISTAALAAGLAFAAADARAFDQSKYPDWSGASRRIFTDGRDWPKEIKPTLVGYAIGKWLDTDGDGRYDALEIETRSMRGPRAFDATGMPLHADNKTIVKEKIYLDKSNPNVMLN